MFFRRNKITSNDNAPPVELSTSTIGADTVIDGNISTHGEVRVEGTVRGTIDAAVCIVGDNGLVEGRILADEVIVCGRVTGPIHGVHVDLRAGAHVEGDVVNGSIAVQNGAHIDGSIWHSDDPLAETQGKRNGRGEASSSYPPVLQWQNDGDDGFRPLKAIKPR